MLCRTLQKPMETVSCSVLHPLPFFNTCSYNKHFQFLKTQLSFLPSFSTNLHFPRKNFPHFNGLTAFRSLPPHNNPNPSQELAILLEVEGVIVDVYWMGNRNAFNTAFRKLGLDCANWPEPVYLDLLRKSAGDEERMLILFFNKIGWPTSVPTSEQKTFMQNVLREKKNALDDLLVSKGLPLRPGVEDFIDDAYNEGIPLLVLTPCCESEDKVRSLPKTIAALHAGSEYAGVPVNNCVLITGSQSGVAGAERVGMPYVVLHSRASQAEFPSASAVLDGFGGADLTISKLRKKLRS
ncbi:CBBY-like protein isoform X3 [Vitis riparia]|uniref:CBBY-like protein isoform X3 n=1 Tax=Vitis riparia TaxID=96939 RepID=UPI00155A19F9|nr:CBBY-like protein isoform X3 [Vitis riparia]